MQVCLIYNLAQLETHAYCSTPDIVLCGNKADLEDKRQVSTERAKQFALEHGLVNVIFNARHTLYLLLLVYHTLRRQRQRVKMLVKVSIICSTW